MKKKFMSVLFSAMVVATITSGCGAANQPEVANQESTETEVKEEASEEISDQEAADRVAALIDAIYVQERTERTDQQCIDAKDAWDALTDEQKALVEGENADPDYFGRDTGDASKDDARNADGIGENEILVVSFGTSFNDSRAWDIKGIEDAIATAYPDWAVRRAFTAQIIINHIQARDAEAIDNMDQALERAVENGVKNLVVQPTHLMHGAEYDEMTEALEKYSDKFESISIAEPLLGDVGSDASVINADKEAVALAITDAAAAEAGFDSVAAADEDGTAFVLMGHGTSHTAKVSYSQMQTQMDTLGYKNVFIGTVEGEPEETACENVIEAVKEAGFKKVILRPLMVVAGDHANNDMAGDEEDSWKSMFVASGSFDSVDTQISGLGRIEAIQNIYIDHTGKAKDLVACGVDAVAIEDLEDGTYLAQFDTDSSMFHVNEACEGQGVLTVKNGKASINIVLTSKNILNLFEGQIANLDENKVLEPTVTTVTYPDGTSEEVNAFDVNVPYLNKEFDLALIGTKGKWYDHKVSVSNPVAKDEQASETKKTDSVNEAKGDTVKVTLTGGSGKSTVESPAKVAKNADGKQVVTIVWSSPNYDYMIVNGEKILPINKDGNSIFEIVVDKIPGSMDVIADTVAMSKPHEIEYTLTFGK